MCAHLTKLSVSHHTLIRLQHNTKDNMLN